MLIQKGILKKELSELEETNISITNEKDNLLKAMDAMTQEKETLQEQIEEFENRVKELQGERDDDEKKNRVNFEMRLVEFEDYRKHAETDIVSSFPSEFY